MLKRPANFRASFVDVLNLSLTYAIKIISYESSMNEIKFTRFQFKIICVEN